MKLLKILAAIVLPLMIFQSCNKTEFAVNQEEGGLIEVKNPALNYVVGNTGPYAATVRLYQGEVKVTKVDVYLSFTSTRQDTLIATDEVVNTQLVSNTVLYTTITPASTNQNSIESFTFSFDDISSPLSIEEEVYPEGVTADDVIKGPSNIEVGDALPATDGEYKIGDSWTFEYHATTSDGRTVVQSNSTKVTVSTRYAGSYNVLAGWYYGPEGLRDAAIWVGEQINIESVDATTYAWSAWGAQFYSNWDTGDDQNNLYFQVDPGTNEITYLPGQILNGWDLLTPYENPTTLTQVIPIAGANINSVIKDDVGGKDQLNMCYGYNTEGTAPREFYFLLEKIVN